MTISERVSYLKGLAEGLGMDSETKEGKIINVMIEILDDIALELTELDTDMQEVIDEMDAISDDLADVEEFVFGTDDTCGSCGADNAEEEEYEYSATCPSCGAEVIATESDLILGEIDCPECGEKLEFDFDEDSEDSEDKD
jgi:DNA-directed RNA polymerase subunit RPC12/RpoP